MIKNKYFEDFNVGDKYILPSRTQTSGIFSTFVYFSFLVFLYHILTGFRHLLMDVHIGENLKASNMSAVFVISFWLVVSIFVLFGFQI